MGLFWLYSYKRLMYNLAVIGFLSAARLGSRQKKNPWQLRFFRIVVATGAGCMKLIMTIFS